MNAKQSEEVELVSRFLDVFGHTSLPLEPSDRPDVIMHADGKQIGIEVTQFHADEKPGVKGSSLRADEAHKAKSGTSYPVWGVADSLSALVTRIDEKISAAATYDRGSLTEMWLLVSSQVPKLGATAATFVFEPFVDIAQLNQATHSRLSASVFSAAYFHLMMSHTVFSWSRSDGWRQEAVQQGALQKNQNLGSKKPG